MLALSPLRSCKDEIQQNELEICFHNGGSGGGGGEEEFLDFSGGNLLDSIDFDDLFVGINDGDVLPDLDMDPELLAEFSVSGGEESQMTTTSASMEKFEDNSRSSEEVVDKGNTTSDFSWDSTICMQGDHQDVMSKQDESVVPIIINPSDKQGENNGRKSASKSSKNAHGKRKMKVDWTPELHRRFVQAVEQLGVDKAVPSRILELMGIHCLTRHNIASHLQKYRSHRKNVLAREAEATNWSQSQSQKLQLYCAPAGGKRVMNPWHAPTIGFPPPMATPPPMHPHFRPLHVWGHPSVNQSSIHLWPKHLRPPAAPPLQQPTWGAAASPLPPLTPDPSFWHSNHHLRVPNPHCPGTPCFPHHLAPVRFAAPPVPSIPPPTMCKIEAGIGVPTAAAGPGQALPQPPLDFQPSKESIDAAIGDVLSKPWLQLPLGLKPPCVDGVLVELQRQGIPKIPPSTVV